MEIVSSVFQICIMVGVVIIACCAADDYVREGNILLFAISLLTAIVGGIGAITTIINLICSI